MLNELQSGHSRFATRKEDSLLYSSTVLKSSCLDKEKGLYRCKLYHCKLPSFARPPPLSATLLSENVIVSGRQIHRARTRVVVKGRHRYVAERRGRKWGVEWVVVLGDVQGTNEDRVPKGCVRVKSAEDTSNRVDSVESMLWRFSRHGPANIDIYDLQPGPEPVF
ncbi:hypothetical protein BDN70DRAFT_296225 [Pholiota conissans]|uniref:Uncharacterized protein n=1 Tax=Pholiota conissans TaxID=109636 RepID=A0A9P5YSM2_9AGAR|nr:hypothetical protein BDN70DRAFT_296225 [Pholiota conissans]